MPLRPRNFPNLIEAAGGHARLAAELKRDIPGLANAKEIVRHWVVREAIPAGWWLAVRRVALRLKIPGSSLETFAQWAEEDREKDAETRRARKRDKLKAAA